MKKQLLTICGSIMISGSVFAQFTATQIWSLNQRVDPITHNSINFSYFDMAVTYNGTGVPVTGISTSQPGLPLPKFRITSTVNGNTTVCVSSEQEDSDPWEDKERASFASDGTADTSIVVEQSNNGGPFVNAQKIVLQNGSNSNVKTYNIYNWVNGAWELTSKQFNYFSNGKRDSVVTYGITGSDSLRGGFTVFYYSTGLDSTLQSILQTSTGQFEVRNKTIVEQKDNGKTKRFSVYAINNTTWSKTATFTYNNGPTSSVNEKELEQPFTFYPNPATTTLQFNFEGSMNVQNVVILNSNFQRVKETNYTSSIDISELSAGLYFVQVVTDKGIATQKFIKN